MNASTLNLTEKLVHEAIESYTQTHGVMPSKIRGTFTQLIPFSWFTSYTKFMGKDVFIVPLATLELELDPNASDWYLA